MVAQIWTKERCADLAASCTTRMEFARAHWAAYTVASRNGWLPEIFDHLPKRAFGAWKWTDERIRKTVARYTDLKQFRTENEGLYSRLWSSGRLSQFTSHLQRDRPVNGYWTKDRCTEAAKMCASRADMIRFFAGAYDAAVRNGWLDEVCESIPRRGNHKLRRVYIIKALGENWVYVGISFDARRRYTAHKERATPEVRKLLSVPHRLRVVTSLVSVDDAADLEVRLIAHFRGKGWRVANTSRGGGPGGTPKKWTWEALADLARTMETRGQMMREHLGAYCAAAESGVLDDLFANHRNRGFGDGPIRDWTEKRIREIAAEYVSSYAMKKQEPKAWHAARRRGLLSKLFSDQEGKT